jgi:MFS family permease
MTTGVERQHYQVTFAVLAAAGAAYALLQSLVVPVLSTIQHDVHTSQATVTWVLTAYLLSASIFTPIMGRLGDMAGKKRIFVISMLALALGSLLAAVATNVDVLIVARVIQGVGGGVLPVSFGIIRDEFPHDKVAGAVGIIASLLAVGAGLGIVLAGPIVDVLDYHWLFWIPMIITVAAAGAVPGGSVGHRRSCSPPGWWRCWSPSARRPPGDGARARSSDCSVPRWCWPWPGCGWNCGPRHRSSTCR